jgi:uncharacterized protein (TIGR02246 family)
MNTSHFSASIFSIAVALADVCGAQTPEAPAPAPEMAVVIASDRAYEVAYAEADVNAVADFFADDAEYVSEDGRTYTGRKQIEESIRLAFAANKGAKLAISADSVRALSPDVVLEKGSTIVTSKSGEQEGALYTAIYVKKQGQWKISQLTESPLPTISSHEHLEELAWLIGEWEDSNKGDDISVRSQFVWSRGGNFMTRNVTVKRAGEVTLEGWQIIGWDPIEENIHAWTFDSEGGFSDGAFSREGNRWLLRENGVTPEGNRTTADGTFTKLNDNLFTWESNNRTVDGDPRPSVSRIEINRVKGN